MKFIFVLEALVSDHDSVFHQESCEFAFFEPAFYVDLFKAPCVILVELFLDKAAGSV